jgi:hypothetical protein
VQRIRRGNVDHVRNRSVARVASLIRRMGADPTTKPVANASAKRRSSSMIGPQSSSGRPAALVSCLEAGLNDLRRRRMDVGG